MWDKGIYLTDETAMIYVYYGTIHALREYENAFKKFLKDELKDGKTLYTDKTSGKKERN